MQETDNLEGYGRHEWVDLDELEVSDAEFSSDCSKALH